MRAHTHVYRYHFNGLPYEYVMHVYTEDVKIRLIFIQMLFISMCGRYFMLRSGSYRFLDPLLATPSRCVYGKMTVAKRERKERVRKAATRANFYLQYNMHTIRTAHNI